MLTHQMPESLYFLGVLTSVWVVVYNPIKAK
jgi:hypothetical protein